MLLKIYQGTAEYYPAFVTPEAYQVLIDWKMDLKLIMIEKRLGLLIIERHIALILVN